VSFLKFKKHLKFDSDELRDILIVGIIFGFIVALGFNSGIANTFSRTEWVSYMIDMTVFSLILMFVFVLLLKMIGIALGYEVRFKLWYLGLLLGVFGGFITQGTLYMLLAGTSIVKPISHLRVGKYFGNYVLRDDAWINFLAFAGILVFALIIKPFTQINPIFNTFISMSVGLVLFGMLPLPFVPGGKIFFASHFLYLFSVGYLLLFAATLMFSTFIVALFAGLLGGLLFMLMYHLIY